MIWASVTSRQIYRTLLRRCSSYRFAGPWIRFTPEADVCACPTDPMGVLGELSEEFSSSALVRAGVATESSDGTLLPATALAEAGAPLVFLCPAPNEAPVEVLTSTGCLSGRHLPLSAAWSDHRFVEALTWRADMVLVAFSLDDVILFRSLGLPAALAAGLQHLTAYQLAQLSSLVGWKNPIRKSAARNRSGEEPKEPNGRQRIETPPSEPVSSEGKTASQTATAPQSADATVPRTEAHTGKSHPSSTKGTGLTNALARWFRSLDAADADESVERALILVNWSPSQLVLTQPDQLPEIRARLRRIQDSLDIRRMEVGIWAPRPAYLDRLQLQLQVDPRLVSPEEMATEIDEGSGDIMSDSPGEPPPPGPPPSFAETRQQLREILHASCGPLGGVERLSEAWQLFDRQLEEEIIQPLYRRKASATGRNLQMALMDASRLLHRLGLVIEGRLLPPAAMDALLRGTTPLPKELLNQVSVLTRAVIALTKELRS
jgi:hypothetical protein